MALESRQGFQLGTVLSGHAPGAWAKVAGRQGAAPPGGSAAEQEREEGTSVEAIVGKVPGLPWEAWTARALGALGPVKTEASRDWVLIWAGTNLL